MNPIVATSSYLSLLELYFLLPSLPSFLQCQSAPRKLQVSKSERIEESYKTELVKFSN